MPEVINRIRFLLGSEPVELDLNHHPEFHPSTTVLTYLRSNPGYRGVKEGCAEGDCGACTVIVAYPDENQRLCYKAVNSCLIFLPWLHGKQLITVEHVARKNQIHPVQQLMVDLYGSQCGFCTPGIVMSLFGLFKSTLPPTRENATLLMSGNLCRCTGYQPILDAAVKALEADGQDHFSENETDVARFLITLQNQSTELDDGRQHYYRPVSFDEALQIRQNHPEALIVNGATDLALLQTKKFRLLPSVLDLSAIEELRLTRKEKDHWLIGSGTSIETLRLLYSDAIPLFGEVFRVFASHQIRNMATLGGNIGSASPIGDTLPVLIALGASLELYSSSGSRVLPLQEFILGYRTTALQTNELIRNIRIPFPDPNALYRFYKVSRRRELDISTVSLAARMKLGSSGELSEVILAYGGMAATPARAVKTESWLTGKVWNRTNAEAAIAIVQQEFSPLSDARATKEARELMAGNLLMKLFVDTMGKEMNDEII